MYPYPTKDLVPNLAFAIMGELANCFGRCRRDNGHKRVPAPPDKMTGWMELLMRPVLPPPTRHA